MPRYGLGIAAAVSQESVAASAWRLLCECIAIFAAETPKLVIGEPEALGGFFLMIARLTERLSQQSDLEVPHGREKRLRRRGIDRHRLWLRLWWSGLFSSRCQAGTEGRRKRVEDNVGNQRRIRTVDSALHDVFQLAHVAWPGIALQGGRGCIAESRHLFIPQFKSHPRGKMVGQQEDILAPLAQRRQKQHVKGEPIEQ